MPAVGTLALAEPCRRRRFHAEGLRRRGVDVTTTTDAGLLGAGDPDHVAFAVPTAASS
jgi:hypothetical protein